MKSRKAEFYEGDIATLMQPGFSNVSCQVCLFIHFQVISEQDLFIDELGIVCINLRPPEIEFRNETTGRKQKLVPNYQLPFQWNGLSVPSLMSPVLYYLISSLSPSISILQHGISGSTTTSFYPLKHVPLLAPAVSSLIKMHTPAFSSISHTHQIIYFLNSYSGRSHF